MAKNKSMLVLFIVLVMSILIIGSATIGTIAQAQSAGGIKLTVLYGQPKSAEDFEKYYFGTHMPLFTAVKGIPRSELAKGMPKADGSPPAFYRIFEAWFDSPEQMAAVTSTPEWKKVGADLPNFASGGVTILISKVDWMAAQGSKKTITLPNGEVIWDLNGEWDVLVENYGEWSWAGSYPQLVKITQTVSSFEGIRMINDPWSTKGSGSIQGELDKSGFKSVQIMSAAGPLNSTGKISDDGNKMVIDDGEKARQTFTRK
jgi:uncharacterized protein (TIGR02118 family)